MRKTAAKLSSELERLKGMALTPHEKSKQNGTHDAGKEHKQAPRPGRHVPD